MRGISINYYLFKLHEHFCIQFGLTIVSISAWGLDKSNEIFAGEIWSWKLMLTGFVTWSFPPSAKQKRELVKTQKCQRKQAKDVKKTFTIMIAVLSQPIWPISNLDHKKWWQTTVRFILLSTQKFRRQGRNVNVHLHLHLQMVQGSSTGSKFT